MPGAGGEGGVRSRRSEYGFRRVRFLRVRSRRRRRAAQGPARRTRTGSDFGDLFGQFFGARRRATGASSTARRRSGVRAKRRFLAGDQGYAGPAEHQPAGECEPARARARPAASAGLPRMQRLGASGSDGRSDAFQSDLSAMRRQGTASEHMSDMLRRRARLPNRFGGGAHSGRCAKRFAAARAGKGNAGTHGAPAGDLYITVRVDAHPFFERDGDNIEIKVPVTVPRRVSGAKIEVPTIDGRALLKIPQGTQERPEIPSARKRRFQCEEELTRRSDRRGRSSGAEGQRRAHKGTAA